MVHNVHKPLPKSTQQIADVIGRDRALHLVRTWKKTLSGNAGQNFDRVCIYIPAKLPLDHELVRVLGYPDAAKLVAEFRGEILYLSTCEDLFRGWRNQAIRRLARDGLKPPELAEWFDISDRQVRNVLREIPIEARIH